MMFGNFRHSYLMKAATPIPEQQVKQESQSCFNSSCDQKFVLPLFDFIILLSLTKFVCIVSEIQCKVIIGGIFSGKQA